MPPGPSATAPHDPSLLGVAARGKALGPWVWCCAPPKTIMPGRTVGPTVADGNHMLGRRNHGSNVIQRFLSVLVGARRWSGLRLSQF